MRYVYLLFFVFACGPVSENEIELATGSSGEAQTISSSHGLWVYSPNSWIDNTEKIDALISLMLDKGMNEIYLSTNLDLIADSHLPSFIERMSNNAISVEALIGKTEWGTSAGEDDMLSQIGKLLDYNAGQSYINRFKGIHLDIEPWIGTGNDTSWVAPLTKSYQVARAALAATSTHLSVDLCGSKVASLALSERQAFLAAANKVVLMQYETTLSSALSHSEQFMKGLATNGSVVVAVRAEDFSDPYSTVGSVNTSLSSTKPYTGWALYDYDEL